MPFTIIFSLQIWGEYKVNPPLLKPQLPIIGFPVRIFDFFVPLFLFLIIIGKLSGGIKRKKIPHVRTLTLFSLWAIISTLWAKKPGLSILYLFLWSSAFLYFVIGFYYLEKKSEFKIFIISWLIFIGFNIVIPIIQKIWGSIPGLNLWAISESKVYYWPSRVRGLFTHANSLSATLTLTITLILGVNFSNILKPKFKKFLYLIAILSGVTIIISLSRTGYISLLLSIALFILYRAYAQRKLNKLFLYIFLIFLSVIFMIFLSKLFLPSVYLRITSIFWGQKDISIATRLIFWKDAIEIFFHRPLTGIGLGQFAFTKHTQAHLHAHNVYLNVLAELGILGLIFLMVFLGNIFKFLFKLTKEDKKDTRWLWVSLLIGWIIICFQFTFDYFWFNLFCNTETKVFFTFLLLTYLLPRFYYHGEKNILSNFSPTTS